MLSRCVQTICDLRFRKLRLQRGQAIYLARVCEHPGINLIDLSNMLKVDKTSTTKVIQKLSGEGYVERIRDENDMRSWSLKPTAAARAAYDTIIQQENHFIDVCVSGFSDNDREKALGLIRRMRENIEGEWAAARA